MSKKPDLKLLQQDKKKENLPKQPRSFWNTVGKSEDYFPEAPRSDSIPQFDKTGRVINEPEDPWWINSKEDHYCFWSYVKRQSHPDGRMDPLKQAEIAELFGCSSTKVHFMLKEAMENLLGTQSLQGLEELLEEDDDKEEFSLNSKLLTELDDMDSSDIE